MAQPDRDVTILGELRGRKVSKTVVWDGVDDASALQYDTMVRARKSAAFQVSGLRFGCKKRPP